MNHYAFSISLIVHVDAADQEQATGLVRACYEKGEVIPGVEVTLVSIIEQEVPH